MSLSPTKLLLDRKATLKMGGEIYCILAEVFVSVVKILSKYGGTLTSLCDGYRWESGHCLCVKGGVKRKELKTEEIL